MNENNNSRFFDGLVLGLILGGLAVFLFGTKSGKKILKKISEEGIENFEEILENYQEEEEIEEQPISKSKAEQSIDLEEKTEVGPKKRFFKRFKRVD